MSTTVEHREHRSDYSLPILARIQYSIYEAPSFAAQSNPKPSALKRAIKGIDDKGRRHLLSGGRPAFSEETLYRGIVADFSKRTALQRSVIDETFDYIRQDVASVHRKPALAARLEQLGRHGVDGKAGVSIVWNIPMAGNIGMVPAPRLDVFGLTEHELRKHYRVLKKRGGDALHVYVSFTIDPVGDQGMTGPQSGTAVSPKSDPAPPQYAKSPLKPT